MNTNSGVQELLERAAQEAAISAEPQAEKDEAPSVFVFAQGKDNIGLPLESRRYVKKSCKRCHGEGYQTFLVGDGYKVVDGQVAPRRARDLRTCYCVIQGYRKTREAVQRAVAQLVKHGGMKQEDAQAAALGACGFGPPVEIPPARDLNAAPPESEPPVNGNT